MNALQLFPTAGFDRSTTTPVLVGVLLSWLFTESFGWVFAGLVVPGYLAAVFAIDPRAGVVDVAETVFTYALARGIGEHLPRTGLTSRVFGRERFLLIVLCSVVVRLFVEGALLPRLAPHAAGAFFSIGLVVVPLAANACWKTGLARGIVQNGVPTLLTWLILRYVLLPHTNLSLAGFELATEDVAASFLDSPKAYILLITGATLAAAANLLDGWDFNGILVPALLSLVVLEPVKLGTTFLEAIVLAAVAQWMLRHTRLSRANVEGPRRLVLFFTLDYALRFSFATVVGRSLPGADVLGLMGFGYLLPTLLAVKIAQRDSIALVLLPTAQVGVSAFALGTLIGFAATMIDTTPSAARAAVTRPLGRAPSDPEAAALWSASLARSAPHAGRGPAPLGAAELLAAVDAGLRDPMGALPGDAMLAERLDHEVTLLRERFEALEDRFGDPTALVTPSFRRAGPRLVLLAEDPVSAPENAAWAARLLIRRQADALVIAGVQGGASSFGAAALVWARALAGDEGLVIAVRRGRADEVARRGAFVRAETSARFESFVRTLEAQHGPLPRTTFDLAGPDAQVTLTDEAIAAAFAAEVLPTSVASLASPAALAEAFGEARATAETTSIEDLMALRRLLLEPLLGSTATAVPLPLLRLRARKLGYELLGPAAFGGSPEGEGLALRPVAPRPLALVVRRSGVLGVVVEAPHGFRDELRDAAARLATGLSADALVFGLEPGGGARGGAALRLAHALACAQVNGRDAKVLVVRHAPDAKEGLAAELSGGLDEVALGAWGGPGREAFARSVGETLDALGLPHVGRPLPPVAREVGGRAVLGDTPLVVVTLDHDALVRTSLDAARFDARRYAALPRFDGSPLAAAQKLAASVPSGRTGPDGPDAPDGAVLATKPAFDLVELARRSTLEASVTARRALEARLASSAARLGLARTARGDVLVLVARVEGGWLAHALRLEQPNPAPPKTSRVLSLRDCAQQLEDVCLAPHP